MKLPVTAIWEETLAFVRREAKLLAPLALATIGMSDATMSIVGDAVRATNPPQIGALAIIGGGLALLLAAIGQLAIIALALNPGMSVAEAGNRAVARIPKLLLVSLVLLWVIAIAVVPLLLMLAASGIDLGTPNPKVPPYISLYSFVALGAIAWLSVRLMTMNSLIVDRNPPLADAFRSAFAMTRGHAVMLLGLAAMYLIVWLIVSGAVTYTIGSLFVILGKASGSVALGKVLTALAGGVVAAALGTISAVFLAKLYRHLAASPGTAQ